VGIAVCLLIINFSEYFVKIIILVYWVFVGFPADGTSGKQQEIQRNTAGSKQLLLEIKCIYGISQSFMTDM